MQPSPTKAAFHCPFQNSSLSQPNCDNELIETLYVTSLDSGSSKTLTFTWNTTGVSKGNYTITVGAVNNFTGGWVIVAMIGDINGPTPSVPDGKVDIRDIALVASKFGAVYPDSRYDANCDLTGSTPGVADGKIDIRDIALVARHFGEIDP